MHRHLIVMKVDGSVHWTPGSYYERVFFTPTPTKKNERERERKRTFFSCLFCTIFSKQHKQPKNSFFLFFHFFFYFTASSLLHPGKFETKKGKLNFSTCEWVSEWEGSVKIQFSMALSQLITFPFQYLFFSFVIRNIDYATFIHKLFSSFIR